MDFLSSLPDDILVQILSYVPTKTRITTSVLAKRYKDLWKSVGSLAFIGEEEADSEKLKDFLDKAMKSLKCSVIDIFTIRFYCGISNPEVIKPWIELVISSKVEWLTLGYNTKAGMTDLLPNSVYTCNSLYRLTLEGSFFLDIPDDVSLPSLRFLDLIDVVALTREKLQKLLSACPLLQSLKLAVDNEDVTTINITHPRLLELNIRYLFYLELIEIFTPSLLYLQINSTSGTVIAQPMPYLCEATISVGKNDEVDSLIRAIQCVEKLTICLTERMDFLTSSFYNLTHAKLCDCGNANRETFFFLGACPKLSTLEMCRREFHTRDHSDSVSIKYIPDCLFKTLETFVWMNYEVGVESMFVLSTIIHSAYHLKTLSISFSKESIGMVALVEFLQSLTPASKTYDLQIEYPDD